MPGLICASGMISGRFAGEFFAADSEGEISDDFGFLETSGFLSAETRDVFSRQTETNRTSRRKGTAILILNTMPSPASLIWMCYFQWTGITFESCKISTKA